MKKLYPLLLTITVFAFGCIKAKKDTEEHLKAYEYLSKKHPHMVIQVMDTVQHIGLTAFSDYITECFGFEGKSSTDFILYLNSLDEQNHFPSYFSSEVSKAFKSHKDPTHILYFSKRYKDYLLLEMFELGKYNRKVLPDYKSLTTMGQSDQYLFVFEDNGKSIKEVHKLTMAYN